MRARGGVRRGFDRLSDRLGGGAVLFPAVKTFSDPGPVNFTAPASGSVTVWAWGGGSPLTSHMRSAGAGGFCRKTIQLVAGQTLVMNVGDRTATASATTVFLDGIINLVANQGGNTWFLEQYNQFYYALGGSASGGDVNGGGQAGSASAIGSVQYGGNASGDSYQSGGYGGSYNGVIAGGDPGGGGVTPSGNYSGSSGRGRIVIAYQQEVPL